jgi:hypothetical protein
MMESEADGVAIYIRHDGISHVPFFTPWNVDTSSIHRPKRRSTGKKKNDD